MLYGTDYHEKLLVRLPAEGLEDHLRAVRTEWQAWIPNHPFEFAFLDATFDRQYRTERRLVPIFTYFTFLTIFVAGLGLFGLVSFVTGQRTKEIGLRKILGAEEWGMVYLLSKEFLFLVVLSVLIASPLAGWAMGRWLADFAYRTDVGFFVFLLAGFAALLVAALTTGYQVLKAARTNPVKALRYE